MRKKHIHFVKAVAAGNDFIIIDRYGSSSRPTFQYGRLAKRLCARRFSVGADGLLVLESSNTADIRMRVFNPDGCEVRMCGNGARCIGLYAFKKKLVSKRKICIETLAGALLVEIKQSGIRIKMPQPKDLRLEFTLDLEGKRQEVYFINSGVPHTVCFVPDLDTFNVQGLGRAIRYHPQFQPQGTNADFVEVLSKRHIKIRTYERGVEEETLACGTGCVAAAIITTYKMQQKPSGKYKVGVETKSGEIITVFFAVENDIIKEAFLEGKAQMVYQGKL